MWVALSSCLRTYPTYWTRMDRLVRRLAIKVTAADVMLSNARVTGGGSRRRSLSRVLRWNNSTDPRICDLSYIYSGRLNRKEFH